MSRVRKICPICAFWRDGYCSIRREVIPSDVRVSRCEMIELRVMPKKTLFDHITTSYEVLAKKLVYPTYGIISRTWDFEKDDWGTAEPSWSSTVLPHDLCFCTEEDAIAATVAKLKEVAE